jgi:hypothetical protein
MKMPSETETMNIFEKLGLGNEEDRARILLQGQNNLPNASENKDKDYYTIQLSANTRIGLVEGNYIAELERDSRRS